MGKPLIRWTVGNIGSNGYKCLQHSILTWKRLYGDRFDIVICFNGLVDKKSLGRLADLVDQSQFVYTLPCPPKGPTWKMYPPRLRLDSHELIIDNDLIIYEQLPALEEFIAGDGFLVTAGHRRFYGQFEEIVRTNANINTGLIGFPPGYDYGSEIHSLLDRHQIVEWLDHSDDQGVFMSLMQWKSLQIIPMEDITVCNPSVDFAPYSLGHYGTHFASINGGNPKF